MYGDNNWGWSTANHRTSSLSEEYEKLSDELNILKGKLFTDEHNPEILSRMAFCNQEIERLNKMSKCNKYKLDIKKPTSKWKIYKMKCVLEIPSNKNSNGYSK